VIFRKVALDRLSSPEQLDQLLQVTTPASWLALSALGALLVSGLAWGFVGSIPTLASGDGMLLRRGGVMDLVATANGQVDEVLVRVGDVIEKGQRVASIRQEALSRQMQDARTKRAALDREYQALLRYAHAQVQLKADELGQQRADLQRSIAALERNAQLLAERVAAEQKLLADGLITKQTLLASEQGLNTARDQLAAARLGMSELELKRRETEEQLNEQVLSRAAQLRDLDAEIRELAAKLAENVNVKSPYRGRVLELMVNRGDLVNPGTPMLNLEVVSDDLMAVIFVPAALGKQVQPGMAARISPSTVSSEEYGYMLGRVSWVAEFPSTARGMTRLLANEALVSKLMTAGPPIQVNVTLTPDAASLTGYRWSSSRGPGQKISSGTMTGGSVVVRRDHPLDLLLPIVRERLGA
jgi:HlyD family secretion protein